MTDNHVAIQIPAIQVTAILQARIMVACVLCYFDENKFLLGFFMKQHFPTPLVV